MNTANKRSSLFQLTPLSMMRLRTTVCRMLHVRERLGCCAMRGSELDDGAAAAAAPALLRERVNALLQPLRFLRQVLHEWSHRCVAY